MVRNHIEGFVGQIKSTGKQVSVKLLVDPNLSFNLNDEKTKDFSENVIKMRSVELKN